MYARKVPREALDPGSMEQLEALPGAVGGKCQADRLWDQSSAITGAFQTGPSPWLWSRRLLAPTLS